MNREDMAVENVIDIVKHLCEMLDGERPICMSSKYLACMCFSSAAVGKYGTNFETVCARSALVISGGKTDDPELKIAVKIFSAYITKNGLCEPGRMMRLMGAQWINGKPVGCIDDPMSIANLFACLMLKAECDRFDYQKQVDAKLSPIVWAIPIIVVVLAGILFGSGLVAAVGVVIVLIAVNIWKKS